MSKLPLKIEVLVYLVRANRPVSVDELEKAMLEKYDNNHKLVSKKRIESYLMAMLNVKMVKSCNLRMDGNDVAMDFQIDDPGIVRYEWIKNLIEKRTA